MEEAAKTKQNSEEKKGDSSKIPTGPSRKLRTKENEVQ